MSTDDLRALGEDIRANGLQTPIVLYQDGDDDDAPESYSILDGRNRLDAMELVGIPFEFRSNGLLDRGGVHGISSRLIRSS